MRKKIIALLLAALTVFSAGCTASAPSSADESAPVITAKSKEKRKIIIDTDTAGDDAVAMITRLSEVLGVDVNVLFHAAAQSDENLIVIMVDDNKVILNGGLPIIKWASCSSRSRPMA